MDDVRGHVEQHPAQCDDAEGVSERVHAWGEPIVMKLRCPGKMLAGGWFGAKNVHLEVVREALYHLTTQADVGAAH
jgi:hypothetical protein